MFNDVVGDVCDTVGGTVDNVSDKLLVTRSLTMVDDSFTTLA